MKAADITDVAMLRAISKHEQGASRWAMRWDVTAELDVPEKIASAKFRRVQGRGLATGCDCGCRGDWSLTTLGRSVLIEANLEDARRETKEDA